MSNTTTEKPSFRWATSKDAVPPGYTQVTMYEEATGMRVATVFDAEAVSLIKSSPDLLEACQSALIALKQDSPAWRKTALTDLQSAIAKATEEP